jgi:transmembrane sensor
VDHIQRKEFLKSKLSLQQCSKKELQELYYLISKYGTEQELDDLINQAWEADHKESMDDEATQLVFKSLRSKTSTSKKTKRYSAVFKIAASLSLLAVLSLYFLVNYHDKPDTRAEIIYVNKATQKGQRASITLSDGTVVTLNAESSITFPKEFSDSVRSVSLLGEAFFEVAPNPQKPFIVESAGLFTEVLGTSFNINTFSENSIDVSVSTGRVLVYVKDPAIGNKPNTSNSKEALSTILLPNQQASFNPVDHSISVNEVDLKPYLAWKSHSLYFEMVPFKEVVKTLERWYNVEIIEPSGAADLCLIRANYHTKESLQNVLDGLQLLVDFDYEFDGPRKLFITAKGCNH